MKERAGGGSERIDIDKQDVATRTVIRMVVNVFVDVIPTVLL
jgi:hypothetical protein